MKLGKPVSSVSLFVIRRLLTDGNAVGIVKLDSLQKPTSKLLQTLTESETTKKLKITKNLAENNDMNGKKINAEIINNAISLCRYLQFSFKDVHNNDVTLSIPMFEKLWRKFGTEENVTKWPIEITTEILFELGRLNRKSESSIRRVVTRNDILMMEKNLLINDNKLLSLREINRAFLGLARLQLWTEIEDKNYPSEEYMTSLKSRLLAEIENSISLNFERLTKVAEYIGGIVFYLSTMTLKPSVDVVELLKQFLEKFYEGLKAEEILTEFNAGTKFFVNNDGGGVRNKQKKVFKKQVSHTSAGAYGLYGFANAMINWKMIANEETNRKLWNLWFKSCDEVLMRAIHYATINKDYFTKVTTSNEVRLLSSMIVAANSFNNLNEFWELRKKFEELILLLTPGAAMSPKTATFLLLQMKMFENQQAYNNNCTKNTTFRDIVWVKLRERCISSSQGISVDDEFRLTV